MRASGGEVHFAVPLERRLSRIMVIPEATPGGALSALKRRSPGRPKGVASRRNGVATIAVNQLRAWSGLHRLGDIQRIQKSFVMRGE
jgi:hypothetical protein